MREKICNNSAIFPAMIERKKIDDERNMCYTIGRHQGLGPKPMQRNLQGQKIKKVSRKKSPGAKNSRGSKKRGSEKNRSKRKNRPGGGRRGYTI